MAAHDKVSIIVPVFNREKCLGRCIESILTQSYRDLEILLIDDGSKDQSGDICEQYRQRDNRIRVVHQDNLGVSAARNAGLAIASGTYIQFADSDDTVKEYTTERLVNCQKQTKADIVICGYYLFKGGQAKTVPATDSFFPDIKKWAGELPYYLEHYLVHNPWNKLYLREKISTPFCTDYSLGEDLLFNLSYLEGCRSIAGIREPLYCYHYAASLYKEETAVVSTDLYRMLLRFHADMFPESSETAKMIDKMYIDDMLYNIKMACISKKNAPFIHRIEKQKEFRNAIRKSRWMLPKSFILYWMDTLNLWGILHRYFQLKRLSGS